jgi:ABC-type sugar transport system ATPase subunit/ribose/xylose/arabinose/galactoside ABC-type transport system permease subunit
VAHERVSAATTAAATPETSTPLLRVTGMSKTFPGLKALDDVSLEVHPGEVVAVLGHNGSGKSTLVKILAGVYQADPGAVVEVRDAEGELVAGPAAREELHFIHQDLGLADILTTVENLGLGTSARGWGFAPVRGAAERRRARQLIARFGPSFDVTVPVGKLSPAQRAIVAIARALDGWTRPDNVLVLDEPTTALHGDEVQVLFEAIRRVASSGAGVVFISHRLDEVLALADRVVVLRDGRVVAEEPVSRLDHDAMVTLIAGREVADTTATSRDGAGAPVLTVTGISGAELSDFSLNLRAGEIVGVGGILGSGREQLGPMLFGAQHRSGGRVEVGGEELIPDDTVAAIESGMAYVPADRRRGGAVMEMSVRENLTLPLMRPLRRALGRLDGRAERAETRSWMATVGLRPPNAEQRLKLFSGGNQQKVVLAKWLRVRPRVLLLDEPTQGVDVGAKAAIYELILAARRDGAGVLLCSSDTKELVSLCDRVLVLREGRVASEIPRESLTEERLVRDELELQVPGGDVGASADTQAVNVAASSDEAAGEVSLDGVQRESWPVRLRRAVAFRNMSALYLLAFMFVVFALWVPDTFLTAGTWRSLLSNQAVTCLVAVGLVVPTACGVIDLAIGAEVGLGAILVARLLVGHVPIAAAVVLSLLAGAAVGIFSWLMITRARIPSFIATLAVSSLLAAAIAWISGSEQIVNLPAGFARLGNGQLLGITYPVYIMLAVAVALWYVLERTPAGRRVYATGGNVDAMGGSSEAAALAGIRVSRVILAALVTSGVVAGLGGLLLTSQLSTGDPTVGPGYLLPVIAAVFLGSTQFRGGRFNIWGTVVAAYVLAVGVKGLQLAGLPIWIPDLFNGAALLVAVGLAAWRRPPVTRREAILRLIRNNTTTAWARKRARRTELIDRMATPATPATAGAAAAGQPAGNRPPQALLDGVQRESWPVRLRRAVAFRNMSALYLLAFMFVVFALWVPDTFLTAGTWRSLLSNQAVTCLVAVGLVVPTACGVIDLAIGAEVGLGAILVARLLVGHVPIAAAVVLSLLAGAAVGIFSWLMITRARIPSFIATLAVSSLLAAAIAWISGSEQIVNLPAGFARLGNGQLLGITYPVYIMLAVAVALWYVLERTPAGRRVYATGGNVDAMGGSSEAAALAGIRVSRVILAALVTSGVVAGLGGLLLTSQLSTGDPTVGPGYLLPVIAAVFLGSTQFRGGRFNIWGTVVAAYVLAVGVKGLQLAGLPIWIPDLFNGAALLVAVGLAAWRRTPSTRRMGLDRFVRGSKSM